jgi:hypothetical protein
MVILSKLRKKNVLAIYATLHHWQNEQDKMTTPNGFSIKSETITTSVALCQKIVPFSVILQWSQLQGDHGILAPNWYFVYIYL